MAEIEAGKKLILIDALSLVFRAFHAPMQMDLRSPTGLPTKAIYIFVRTLQKIMKDQRSEYVAVSFDLAAPTFRDKLFEAYKANRPPFPEELAVQLPYVRRFCRALGLPLVEKEGYEADDVLGTLAGSAAQRGMNVFIVSGDEDLFQLVNDSVRVLKPSRGANESETLCDAAKVEEILGVRPAQVVDWLALTGDPSDNIPGARPLPGSRASARAGGQEAQLHRPQGRHGNHQEVWHARKGAAEFRASGKTELPRGSARFPRRGAAQPRSRYHPHRRSLGSGAGGPQAGR